MARVFPTLGHLIRRRTTFELMVNFHRLLTGSDILSGSIGQLLVVACRNLLFSQPCCMSYICLDDQGTWILEARTTLIPSSVQQTPTQTPSIFVVSATLILETRPTPISLMV
ncbi:hypothetical protein SLE2022_225770 [Rubroshorea leprosula]